jgi:hypothetical protein
MSKKYYIKIEEIQGMIQYRKEIIYSHGFIALVAKLWQWITSPIVVIGRYADGQNYVANLYNAEKELLIDGEKLAQGSPGSAISHSE